MLGPSITQTVQNPKLNWLGNLNTLLSTRTGDQVLNFFSSPNKIRYSPNNGLYVYSQRRAVLYDWQKSFHISSCACLNLFLAMSLFTKVETK